MLEMYCQNTVINIKMVGKIYHKEPQGSLKGCINKQNTQCLKCKKPTNNKSITPKHVANELIVQKSTCADFGSKKSIFVEEYKPNKKKKYFFTNYKHDLLFKL